MTSIFSGKLELLKLVDLCFINDTNFIVSTLEQNVMFINITGTISQTIQFNLPFMLPVIKLGHKSGLVYYYTTNSTHAYIGAFQASNGVHSFEKEI